MNEDRFVPPVIEKTSEPLPLDEGEPSGNGKQNRLWIGGMEQTMTEFNMLQILKKFGKIKEFDFLVHKNGALQGQTRGFCFVTYEDEIDANAAIANLNNKRIGTKKIQVRHANQQQVINEKHKDTLKLPADITKTTTKNSTDTKKSSSNNPGHLIKAIEQKLLNMQKHSEEKKTPNLHPLLALSKQNAAELQRQQNKPYYIRRKHKK